MKITLISNNKIIAFMVSLALFMDSLDASIINTAIPAMSQSLKVNPVDLKIALISYLLSLAIFIPISGWVADKFGTKRAFIGALAIFTISSLWCGYAQTLTELVIARSIQGLGGSLMLPLGRLIILRTFPRHEVVAAMNQVIMVVSIGLMLGPLAGGFITDHLSWHWIFLVNIPVGLIAIIISGYFFKDTSPKKVRPFDLLGFILFGGGLACLTFSLSELSESAANTQAGLLIMCIAFLMLFSYVLYSRNQRYPIVNIQLFQIRTFQISILGNLLSRLSFGGIPFLLPLLLQVGLGYSAQLSGLLLAPIALGIILIKSFTLRLFRAFGYKKLLLFNTILVALSLWLFMIIDSQTSKWVIACLTCLYGFLIALQFSSINSLAYADISSDDFSAATSIVSTTQQLAQSFGVAVGALLLRHYSLMSAEHIQLTTSVFHYTFFTLGIFTLLSMLSYLRLKDQDGHQMLRA